MLQLIIDWFIYGVLRLPAQSKLAGVVNFFLYDSIKITLLLFVLITAIGFLRTFLPQQKIKAWLN
ncbi:MAG: permease, partial [Candidatus Omnitrophota bacterium]